MTSCVINVMGEKISLFSLEAFPSDINSFFDTNMKAENVSVLLYPSVDCDFAVRSFDKNFAPHSSFGAPIVAAAAFLILKRGLPLDEIVFDTESVPSAVFYAGGVFNIRLMKCILSYTESTVSFMGADVEFCAVKMKNGRSELLMVETENVDAFDFKKAASLMTCIPKIPSLLVALRRDGGSICARTYSAHCVFELDVALLVSVLCAFFNINSASITLDGVRFSVSEGFLSFSSVLYT